MKEGDPIRVKDGTNNPDFKGKDLSGYTGYIEDIDYENFVCILWDESTLERFDKKLIKECDRKNLDYKKIILSIDDIEVIEPVDNINVNKFEIKSRRSPGYGDYIF